MHKYNKQQGGTILGIIIGLIIGLGIALGVAMMISKTPMPFTDKSGRQKLNEPTADQGGDPNKPLYGKMTRKAIDEAAKDPAPANTAAPQPFEKKQEVKFDPKQDAKPEVKPEPKAEAKTEVKADGKATVVEKTAEPKKADAEADDKWIYFLQAGAFRDQGDAEGMRAKLALQGVEAKVSERQADTGVLYRVRVGPFNQIDAMNKVRGKLSDNGVDAAVVRVAK